MNASPAITSGTAGRPSPLARLKVPGILLLIAVNLLIFGGNALIDIWQAFGPGTAFSGTITGQQRQVTRGENSQELLLITIATTQAGQLIFDVPQHTFDDTKIGQQVTGERDSFGVHFLDHDEGLRSLSAGGKNVLRIHAISRVAQQLIVLAVVLFVCTVTARWVLSRNRRPRLEALAT